MQQECRKSGPACGRVVEAPEDDPMAITTDPEIYTDATQRPRSSV